MNEQKIIDFLLSIENTPRLYFGDNYTLKDVRSFTTGYSTCLYQMGDSKNNPLSDEFNHFFHDFTMFVSDYYGESLSLSACDYVLYFSDSDETAFKKYFELFHQFLEQRKSGDGSSIDS